MAGDLITPPRLQEYVILRRDLQTLCHRLEVADCTFPHFSTVTIHSLNIHPQLIGFRYPEIMDDETHTNMKDILDTYRSELSDITNLTLEGAAAAQPSSPDAAMGRFRALAQDFQSKLAVRRILVPEGVLQNLETRLARGQELVERGEFLVAAAGELSYAVANMAWLRGREYRGLEITDGHDEEWRLQFDLRCAFKVLHGAMRTPQWSKDDAQRARIWCRSAQLHRLNANWNGAELALASCASIGYTGDEKLRMSI